MVAALSAQNSQAEAINSQAPPQTTPGTSTATTTHFYSTTPPIPTAFQDGSASEFPKGWNPITGYGMPLDFFTTPSKTQFNASATQQMTPRNDPSATQLTGSQQDASATQPNAHNAWNLQMSAQFNASAPPPMTLQ